MYFAYTVAPETSCRCFRNIARIVIHMNTLEMGTIRIITIDRDVVCWIAITSVRSITRKESVMNILRPCCRRNIT